MSAATYANASQAFELVYDSVMRDGIDRGSSKALLNLGFYIENPSDTDITVPWRKWKRKYAQREWEWYLSGNPDARGIAKHAKIWLGVMGDDGTVNSNYGHQWSRNGQLSYAVEKLRKDRNTRQSAISIYDAKEHALYSRDTPCTYAVQFQVVGGRLDMTVLMRSNDLVFGFCNDQYCFSMLMKMVAGEVGLPVGRYYHFAANMHVYERHYLMREKWKAATGKE